MKNKVFLDTGGLVALFSSIDAKHTLAVKSFDSLQKSGYRLFTSDAVLDELVTMLRTRLKFSPRQIFQVLHNLFTSDLNVFELGRDEFGKAMDWLYKYSDHPFSMTDCMSFVAMKELKIKDAFTTDKHFEIAGFRNLMECG